MCRYKTFVIRHLNKVSVVGYFNLRQIREQHRLGSPHYFPIIDACFKVTIQYKHKVMLTTAYYLRQA